jgi:hypothetical protein
MGIFFVLKLPCSNHPRIIPTDKIKNINNALDIDSVQNKNVNSTGVTFWKMNNTAIPARMMPTRSFAFISIPLSLKLFFHYWMMSYGATLPMPMFTRIHLAVVLKLLFFMAHRSAWVAGKIN